jgi:primosomal protein N' (replication factor Y)
VLPDVPALDRELDYLVPDQLVGELRVGTVVRVPLQGRRVRGWVLAFPVQPEPGVELRPLAKVTGWGPEPSVVAMAPWAAWRWAGRRRSLLVTASADFAVRQLVPAPVLHLVGVRAVPSSEAEPSRAVVAKGLVREAVTAGTHLLRLPPDHDATEVVVTLAQRGPVLVVVPSEDRASAGAAALRRRGLRVAQLPAGWAQARAGAQVVIGTRRAAWGPCPGMAAAVVFEAHDEALVQEQAPTWDAPSVLAERARRAGVPCLWISACPTLEMLAGASSLHVPSRSAERAGWAALQVVDYRQEDPRSGLYSAAVVNLLRSGARVLCVLNRKGRASLLACAACAELARCEDCGGALALAGDGLACRRCGRARPVVCASCGSDALRALRVGVTRAREQLEALAGQPVGEVTAAGEVLPDARVLVGTEALLCREHDLRATGGVDAVAFLDFDQELLAPRYRAAEEALALLARASRLVGGRRRGGKVLVQTRAPGHVVIEAATLAEPGRVPSAEEPVRKALRLPPFAAVALLSGPGAGQLAAVLDSAARGGGSAGEPSLAVSGPDGDRWLVRAADHVALANALAAAGRPTGERVRTEVGPVRY